MAQLRTTRFSGLEWAEELKRIVLVGAGGIGSWTALNLSRIGHDLELIDGDSVDETNVHGGQMFRTKDIGKKKVSAVLEICREFGCINDISAIDSMFEEDWDTNPITITGLDNMKARKLVFDRWVEQHGDNKDALFIDGRLLAENMEVLAVQGGNEDQIANYKSEYMFTDDEVDELDCTTKQSTFSAMGISSLITATLCNFLTNRKLDFEMREVPFYQRLFYPISKYDIKSAEKEVEVV